MGVQLGDIVLKTKIELKQLSGKIVAIDAMNSLYQFLAIIRQRDGQPLKDSKGRVTSHLSGLFYRTTNLVELGIRPIYVFDGEPPKLKRRTVKERIELRKEAAKEWTAALEAGDVEGGAKIRTARGAIDGRDGIRLEEALGWHGGAMGPSSV